MKFFEINKMQRFAAIDSPSVLYNNFATFSNDLEISGSGSRRTVRRYKFSSSIVTITKLAYVMILMFTIFGVIISTEYFDKKLPSPPELAMNDYLDALSFKIDTFKELYCCLKQGVDIGEGDTQDEKEQLFNAVITANDIALSDLGDHDDDCACMLQLF